MIDVWLVLPLWFLSWGAGIGIGWGLRGEVQARRAREAAPLPPSPDDI
jgi:hypothetical protein